MFAKIKRENEVNKERQLMSVWRNYQNGYHDLPINSCFIIYESKLTKEDVAQKYRTIDDSLKNKDLWINGQVPVEVRTGANPEDIVYENLGVSVTEKKSRLWEQILVLFLVGFLCLSTTAFFVIWQDNTNPNTDICFKYSNVKYDTLNINDIQAQYCYCSQETYATLISTDKAASCGEYLKYKNLRVLILFVIGFINFSASRKVCNFMTTSDDYFLNIYKFKMRRNTTRNLTLLFILNFGITLVILNSKLIYPDAGDFTRKWYLEVGSPLVSFFGMICLFSVLHSISTRILKAITIKLRRQIVLL
jgi:hypothetical protein